MRFVRETTLPLCLVGLLATSCGDSTGTGGTGADSGAGGFAGAPAEGGAGGAVGAAPVVTITLPAANAMILDTDQPVEVQGAATDVEDGDITSELQLIWTADEQVDPIAEGTHNFAEVNLPVGAHVIHFTATDSDGNSATASVDITIQ